MNERRIIHSTASTMEADFIRIVLVDHGIDCDIENQAAAALVIGLPSAAAPLLLTVAEKHAEVARQLVSAALRTMKLPASNDAVPMQSLPCGCGRTLEIPEGSVAQTIECPYCGRAIEIGVPDSPGAQPARGAMEEIWFKDERCSIDVTADRVSISEPGGRSAFLPWTQLESVSIRTTSEGPLAADVFFVLEGDGKRILIPQGGQGDGALVERLQSLPGFDNAQMIQAMACTEDRLFPCWSSTFAGRELGIAFNCGLSFAEILSRLDGIVPWGWRERDCAWYGNLASARPESPRGSTIKLDLLEAGMNEQGQTVVAGGGRRYCISLRFQSAHAEAAHEWDELERRLRRDVLPALGSTDLFTTDSIDA